MKELYVELKSDIPEGFKGIVFCTYYGEIFWCTNRIVHNLGGFQLGMSELAYTFNYVELFTEPRYWSAVALYHKGTILEPYALAKALAGIL